MGLRVAVIDGGHRLVGDGDVVGLANRWLAHLEVREFSPRTVRAYAFDALNFARFLEERSVAVADVVAMDLFDWLAWQSAARPRCVSVSSLASTVAALSDHMASC